MFIKVVSQTKVLFQKTEKRKKRKRITRAFLTESRSSTKLETGCQILRPSLVTSHHKMNVTYQTNVA